LNGKAGTAVPEENRRAGYGFTIRLFRL